MMREGMVIDMNDKQLLTLAQLQAFLNGTLAVDFSLAAEERYDFIACTVCRFGYGARSLIPRHINAEYGENSLRWRC